MPTPESAQRVLQAIQEYLAEPGESPLKDVLQGVLPDVQAAVGGGEGAGVESPAGAPGEGDPLAALMATAQPGTPLPEGEGQAAMAPSGQEDLFEEGGEIPEEETSSKTYEGARAGALKTLEAKGGPPQPRKRKRRG